MPGNFWTTSLQTILRLLKAIIAVVVLFDPAIVAGFDKPQQYATPISNLFVNGIAVLKKGKDSNANPIIFIKHRVTKNRNSSC